MESALTIDLFAWYHRCKLSMLATALFPLQNSNLQGMVGNSHLRRPNIMIVKFVMPSSTKNKVLVILLPQQSSQDLFPGQEAM
eukprot:3049086-Amphidinium_carterae.1